MHKDIMKGAVKVLGLFCFSQAASAGVIYGIEHIEDNPQRVDYPAYVQMGSFSTIHSASKLQHQMQANTTVHPVIQPSQGQYKVMVGPFYNQSSLKAFARQWAHHTHQPAKPSRLVLQKPKPATESTYALYEGSHPELSVLLGYSYIPNTINGETLQLMPYEIGHFADTFTHQSDANAFTWAVDAKYRFKLHDPSQDYFFDSIGAGIDIAQITGFNQTGNVLQFNRPEFENYTYTLNLNTLRVMADFDVDLHPIRESFVPFVEAGIGTARTVISYNSIPISPVISPDFSLPSETTWALSYQAGAGIKYLINRQFIFSLRYLYANMGNVNSSTAGSTTTLATPLNVNMSTQNVFFGLTYSME